MDPAVFLTNPESGAVKAFMKVARPSIRRWVENHYEYFRRQFTPSRPRLYGSFRIEGGHMLRHHLLGEHSTEQDGRPVLFSLPYDNKTSLMEDYPRMNLDFDSWLYGAHASLQQGHIWLQNASTPAAALQQDVREGGQGTYFTLPSLAKMIVDNVRLGYATPKQISDFMAVTLMSFDGKQGKAEKQRRAVRSNIFNTRNDGSRDFYTFFETLDTILRSHPDYTAMRDAARLPRSGLNTNQATRTLSQMYDKDDGTAGLDRFSDIDYDKFKKAMGEYLQPLIKLLVAPFPVGQIVSLLEPRETAMVHSSSGKIAKNNRTFDAVREGKWRVQSVRRKDNKDKVDLVSEVDGNVTVANLSVNLLTIPSDEDDLRASSDVRSNSALPLFEAVVEAFLYIDHVNCMTFTGLNHNRFTKNHFFKFDGTNTTTFNKGGPDEGIYFGDWFINARTDHTLAFYANMWDKNPKMRKQLENLFKDDNFALAEIEWYTEIISKHLNPVLIPQMQRSGIPTQAVMVPPVLPPGQQRQVVGDLKPIDLKLESPLLRDAYLSYTQQFNEWFSQLLIGVNRGYLYSEPFGPGGTGKGAKKEKKAIKAARDSMKNSITEAWKMVLASVKSLRNLQIPEDEIIRVVQAQVVAAHTRYGTSRPSLPPVARKTSMLTLTSSLDSTRATR